VLITNIIDIESAPGAVQPTPATTAEPTIIQDLWYGFTNLNQRSAIEAYHDAVYWLSEAQTMFTHGILNLTQRAHAEQSKVGILKPFSTRRLLPEIRPNLFYIPRRKKLTKLLFFYHFIFLHFQSKFFEILKKVAILKIFSYIFEA
jgi:hypothetical protein